MRFQGFHADDLLVVLDEACGVPEEIWDAVEGVCVGGNNRVLAISNPLSPTGYFYSLFKSPRWAAFTISALSHPNVTTPDGPRIPGAVTREAVEDRISAWCEEEQEGTGNREQGTGGGGGKGTGAEENETIHDAGLLTWEGKRYRPNPLFRSRVLGEFPESASDSLFEIGWIERAMRRQIEPGTPVVIAVDVARFGADETILALRRGDCVTEIRPYRGLNTMQTARKAREWAAEVGAETITVDEVGIGAGVVDRMEEEGVPGLVPVQFGGRPFAVRDGRQFLNLRAQTFFALRERLREGTITLPPDAALGAQLTNLRYGYTMTGQIVIESKEEMRRRGLPSPDRADAVALLFGPSAEFGRSGMASAPACYWPHDLRAEPVLWDEVTSW